MLVVITDLTISEVLGGSCTAFHSSLHTVTNPSPTCHKRIDTVLQLIRCLCNPVVLCKDIGSMGQGSNACAAVADENRGICRRNRQAEDHTFSGTQTQMTCLNNDASDGRERRCCRLVRAFEDFASILQNLLAWLHNSPLALPAFILVLPGHAHTKVRLTK